MKVLFSSTWLASGGREGTNGANWNGTQVNDEAAFFRAAAASYFPRGEKSTAFQFSVSRLFDSEAQAITFGALHLPSLPDQADLTVMDDAGTVALVLADAVLDVVSIGPVNGCSVEVGYRFLGGIFTSESVPAAPTEDNVKRGQVAVSASDTDKSVAFAVAFGSVPTTVDAWLVPPTGASPLFIRAVPLYDTITAAGFDVEFEDAIPGAGWYLFWEAAL